MTRLASLLLSFFVLLAPHLNAAERDDPIAQARNASWDAYYAGDYERARTKADEVLQKLSTDAWSHLLLGKIMEDEGDWGDDHLRRAEELAGNDASVLGTLAETWLVRYAELQDSGSALAGESGQAAERIFRRWSSVQPESAAPLHGIARVREAAGDVEGAIGLLYAAIAKDPNGGPHADLWKYLGSSVTYARLTAFYEGLSLGTYDAPTRARCLDYAGQVLASDAAARKAAASVAASKRDNLGKVNQLQQAKDLYLRAIDAAEGAILVDAAYTPLAEWNIAHYKVGIGEVYRFLNDLPALLLHVESSRDLLGKVARANPDAEQPKTDIGTLADQMFVIVGGEAGARSNKDRWMRAMQALQEYWTWAATEIDPQNAIWWNNAGFFGRESERFEESLAAYKRCVELDPESVRGLNDTALILLYNLHRDYDDAERMLLKAVALGAEQYPATVGNKDEEEAMRSAWGDAMLNLGLCYLEKEQWDDAEKALAQLTEFDGERYDLANLVDRLAAARKLTNATEEEVISLVSAAISAVIATPEDVGLRNALVTLHNEILRQRDRFANSKLILARTNDVLNLVDRLALETRRARRSDEKAAAAEQSAREAEDDDAENDDAISVDTDPEG